MLLARIAALVNFSLQPAGCHATCAGILLPTSTTFQAPTYLPSSVFGNYFALASVLLWRHVVAVCVWGDGAAGA